jgi:hypothetical protein
MQSNVQSNHEQVLTYELPRAVLSLMFGFLSWRCKLSVLNFVSKQWNSTRACWSELHFVDVDAFIQAGRFYQVLESTQLAKLDSFLTDDTALIEPLCIRAFNLGTLNIVKLLDRLDFQRLVQTLSSQSQKWCLQRTRQRPLELNLVLYAQRDHELVWLLPLLDPASVLITTLYINGFKGSFDSWVQHIPDLQELHLFAERDEQEHTKSLDFLRFLPSLRQLRLARWTGLTNEALQCLQFVPGLIALSLVGCDALTDAGFERLAEMLPCLASFAVNGSVSEAILPCLPRSLRQLHVAESAVRLVTPERWQTPTLRQLTRLDLWSCDVTDFALQCLAKMYNLQELSLSMNPKLSGTGFIWIRHLCALRTLNLSNCTGLKVFDDVPRGLTKLDLSFTNLGEKQALSWLNNLVALESLNLSTSRVSDDTIRNIGSLPKLRVLDICGCAGLTEACVDFIRNQFPRLETLQSFQFKLDI